MLALMVYVGRTTASLDRLGPCSFLAFVFSHLETPFTLSETVPGVLGYSHFCILDTKVEFSNRCKKKKKKFPYI